MYFRSRTFLLLSNAVTTLFPLSPILPSSGLIQREQGKYHPTDHDECTVG